MAAAMAPTIRTSGPVAIAVIAPPTVAISGMIVDIADATAPMIAIILPTTNTTGPMAAASKPILTISSFVSGLRFWNHLATF